MSEKVKFKGRLMWAKNLFTLDSYMGNDSWKVGVEMDDASVELFNEWKKRGIRLRKDGNYTSFKRPNKKVFNGEEKTFEAPVVTIIKDDEEVPFDSEVWIGNGTEAEVLVEFYPFEYEGKKGYGHRLEAVRIIDLVPYEKPEEKGKNVKESDETKVNPWG